MPGPQQRLTQHQRLQVLPPCHCPFHPPHPSPWAVPRLPVRRSNRGSYRAPELPNTLAPLLLPPAPLILTEPGVGVRRGAGSGGVPTALTAQLDSKSHARSTQSASKRDDNPRWRHTAAHGGHWPTCLGRKVNRWFTRKKRPHLITVISNLLTKGMFSSLR